MIAKKLHRWNAVFLSVYILAHFITHLSGVFGIDAYNHTQAAMRVVYRNQHIEPLLLQSVFIQVALGGLLLVRQVRKGLRGKWAHIQAISGGILLYFIAQHVIAMMLARWVDNLDTNFYWPASVMSSAPFVWYFFPYYFLGVSALFIHMGCGVRLALMRSKLRPHATLGFWGLTILGLAIAMLINLILMGAFFEIRLPDEWLDYLRGFVPDHSP